MGESEINTEKRRERRTLTIFLATEKIIGLLMLGTMITIQTRGKGDARRLIVLSAPVIVCIARARRHYLPSRQSNRTDSASICFDTTIVYRGKTMQVGRVQLTLLKAVLVLLLEFVPRIDRGTRARPEGESTSAMDSASICHQRETRINMLIFLPHEAPHTGAQQTALR